MISKSISVSRQYAPLRICADICFYFFVVSLFSFSVLYTVSDETGVHGVVTNLIEPWSLQLAVFVAVCFVLGLLITHIDSAALRFVLSLLPGLTFLMSPFQPIMLIHVAAWVYFIIVMTIGSFEVHLDVYHRRAGVMLFVTLILALCLIIFHFGTDAWYYAKLFGGEVYGLLFFVLCVLSLRGMRASLGAPKKMKLLDTAYVVALPALLLSVIFLLRSMVPMVTFLFSLLSRFLILLSRIFPHKEMPDLFHQSEEADVNKNVQEEPLLIPPAGDNSPGEEMMSGEDPHFRISPQIAFLLMIVFLAAVLVFIAIWLIRRKQKRSDKPRLARESIERTPFETLLRRSFGDSVLPANVRQIRKIYRSYLGHIRSLRMRISPSDTSEDVLAFSTKYLDMPENKQLRELYIAARYGDPDAVTFKQVGEARRCLGAIEAAKSRMAD